MLYLLDANVLIDADRDYYPIDRVPEFWYWLLYQATQGKALMPTEVYDEVVLPKSSNPGLLERWLTENRNEMVFQGTVDPALVAKVVETGYGNDLTDEEVEKIGRDPFLVAYALVDPNNRVVVTTEHSRPTRTRANRHIPDVCRGFGIRAIDTFGFIRELNFRTDWRSVQQVEGDRRDGG